MDSRKIENEQTLEQVKHMIDDLSVDIESKKNGFVQYPTANIDILKNLIINSDFSFGRFDEQNNLSAFLLAYPIDQLSWEIVAKDPIINHIKQNEKYQANGIYLDMIWITEKLQWRTIGKNLLKEILSKAKEHGYTYITGPVIISPHKNTVSIKLFESLWWKLYEIFEYEWLVFGIYTCELK